MIAAKFNTGELRIDEAESPGNGRPLEPDTGNAVEGRE